MSSLGLLRLGQRKEAGCFQARVEAGESDGVNFILIQQILPGIKYFPGILPGQWD